MSNEIASTHEIAERDWDGGSEPGDVASDMVATVEPEGKGIEFHVSMRDYTMEDMESLIVEAAARTIVGRRLDSDLAKMVEAKCIELITEKADKTLASVTSEIIDQPIIPKFSFSKPSDQPVTMREFIGLTGRDYLTAIVDSTGKPTTDRYYGKPRIQFFIEQAMQTAFKREIEKATSAAISEVQQAIREHHAAMIKSEKKRFKDALAKISD